MPVIKCVDDHTTTCVLENINRIRLLCGMTWKEFNNALNYVDTSDRSSKDTGSAIVIAKRKKKDKKSYKLCMPSVMFMQ